MDEVESALTPGFRLDRYELLSPIASGGMASVWLARLRGKRGFEKLFAIKTIKSELTDDARFQEMFLDEARIASGIQHPNVAQILDLGEQGDVLYIVMEWAPGESLAKIRRLAKKAGSPMPLGVALRIVAGAAAGLHAAHELRDRSGEALGVVHRDVSPQNILVTGAGAVKVIDFGVAKARDRYAGETGTGVVKGKIRYMAPEQASGHKVDRRADVWALGVCLHELVTGTLPFDGDSDVDVLRRLIGDEPVPRIDDEIAEPVREILERALARDPNDRFATAAAMERAIEDALDAVGPVTNDDVAEFLKKTLPELETKRDESVAKALAASEARANGARPEPAPSADDPALQPTVVSERSRSKSAAKSGAKKAEVAEAPTLLLTNRKKPGAKKKKKRSASAEDSREMSTSAAVMVAETPKRRSAAWVVVLVGAAAAGAWFVWPGEAALRSLVMSEAPPEPTPTAQTPAANEETRAKEAVTAKEEMRAPPSGLAPVVATASAAPSIAASASTSASGAPSSSAPVPAASSSARPAVSASARPNASPRPLRPRAAAAPAPAEPPPGDPYE